MASCVVSYLDTFGIRHTVEVQAESLYEAAALAFKTFKELDCEPSQACNLEIEVRKSVTHTVTLKKVHDWVNSGARNPKEALMKDRLRGLF